MDRELVGGCRTETAPASLDFERRAGWESALLACECGERSFRLIGWPRAAAGRGGVFWRTFARVFREARAAMQPPELAEPPFFLPLFAVCERCGREACLLDHERISGRIAPELRELPRESYRCRVCRRAAFSIGVAIAAGPLPRDGAAVEVRVHCAACHRTASVAWSDARPSEREQRLDLLYGRR